MIEAICQRYHVLPDVALGLDVSIYQHLDLVAELEAPAPKVVQDMQTDGFEYYE